jgi:protein-S-isoprenylcysteine O-methyltransferase Ste14
MALNKSVIRGSVAFFYLLIALEIVIMITPFAAYFYAVYGPLLNFLYAYPETAWLTGFFLPHAAISRSTALNFINNFGLTLFSFGIIAFLIGAAQIYSAKFQRRGVVTGLLYRWIRHPQYLFLAIAGLGLLLFWPRFFILILYISMLFIYYLLAKHEEQLMLLKYGEGYRSYLKRTAMFIPGEPGSKLYRSFFGRIKNPGLALTIAYGTSLISAIVVGLILRNYTISQTSIIYIPEKKITVISVFPQSEQSLTEIIEIAYQDTSVAKALENFQQQGHKGFLVHIMPMHYMMEGLFVQPAMAGMHEEARFSFRSVLRFIFPFLSSRRHHKMMGTSDTAPLRLIFSQLTWPNKTYAPYDKALAFTVKRLPLMKVDVNLSQGIVISIEKTPSRNLWGQMPMPAY